jgi:hypothetical protein
MRSFDQRFKPKAPEGIVAALTDAPVGTTATVRAVVFTKTSSKHWANDFRVGMSHAEVASVLAEAPHTLQPPA